MRARWIIFQVSQIWAEAHFHDEEHITQAVACLLLMFILERRLYERLRFNLYINMLASKFNLFFISLLWFHTAAAQRPFWSVVHDLSFLFYVWVDIWQLLWLLRPKFIFFWTQIKHFNVEIDCKYIARVPPFWIIANLVEQNKKNEVTLRFSIFAEETWAFTLFHIVSFVTCQRKLEKLMILDGISPTCQNFLEYFDKLR